MKKSAIFYFFCLFFVLVKSDVTLTDSNPTKITVPTDELILHIEDKNIGSDELTTVFCFASKDVTTKDEVCGENQCSIRIKFYVYEGINHATLHYLETTDATTSDSVDIKIDNATISPVNSKVDVPCSWDDHGGKYLLVKATNISDRVVLLKNTELSTDTSSKGSSTITLTVSTLEWYIFGIIIGITVLFD
uniref:Uncharacterized protein n=1 Tax=Panagrolaimus sp. JU765 TaxID=591449 RepID=A0AC34RL26_9BILA